MSMRRNLTISFSSVVESLMWFLLFEGTTWVFLGAELRRLIVLHLVCMGIAAVLGTLARLYDGALFLGAGLAVLAVLVAACMGANFAAVVLPIAWTQVCVYLLFGGDGNYFDQSGGGWRNRRSIFDD